MWSWLWAQSQNCQLQWWIMASRMFLVSLAQNSTENFILLWFFQFSCAQCFRPFPDGLFYEFEARKYCEHCFHVLYAPCCGKCGEFIVGRVIKAMNASWHPKCFCCEMCHKELADLGFVKNQGKTRVIEGRKKINKTNFVFRSRFMSWM